jgi:CoA:oxalate CoA-transferase
MQRRGNRDRYAAPANTFPTRDGEWVHLVVSGDVMFAPLVNLMGRPELAQDARFRSNDGRMQNVEALEELVTGWTRTLATGELLERLKEAGIPSAKVASVADLVDLPHLAHRNQILEMQHPKAGRVPMQGFAVRFGESPMQLRHPPPMLGQHTGDVLEEWLGMAPADVEKLRASGAA